MKIILITTFIFSFFVFSSFAQDLTLEQILDKFYNANSYDKLQKVNSIIMSGHITKQDYMPLKIIKMRPDKYKMEFDIQDVTAYQSYDGKTGWMTTPWTGNIKPQLMQEDALKDIRAKADFDGVIFHWKEKGHKAELIGKEKMNDLEVYKIKLTRQDGGIEYYFIDSKDFLLQKKITSRISRGKDIEVISLFTDYKEVEGIKFAFTNENLMGGQPYSTIQYDSIELNQTIDAKTFSIPE